MIRTAAALLAVLALPGLALAETRRVPSEQYPTIQSAVVGVGSGDVILVAKGTYTENITISGNNPFTIKGSGKPVIDAAGGIGISIAGVQNITVAGVVIVDAQDGILVSNSYGIVLTGVSVVAPSAAGFHFRNNSQDNLVSKCSVSGSAGEGILDEESTGLVVTKCKFTNTGLAAIALSPNYFTDSSTGSNGAIVTKNKITGAGAHAIHFGGSGVLVSKNKVVTSAGTGIYNDPNTSTAGAVVEKNKVTGSGVDGIYVSGSSAVVSKNKVKDANSDGIEAAGSGGHTIEKNKIAAADVDGIHLVSAGNILTKNKASKDGEHDLHDENAEGANTYDGNKFGTTFFGGAP